jgi:hypothetical protein
MKNRLLVQLLLAAGFLTAIILGTAQGQTQETGGNPHGPLRWGCEHCHSPEGWRPLREPLPFDHGKETGFALIKSHQKVACLGCHQNLRFQRVASACADCHRDPHRGELGLSCESCHSPHGWDSRRRVFEIHNASLFPLTGAHAAVDCGSCHRGSPPFEFRGTPMDCFSCHAEDYRRAQPDHVRSGFPTTCETCHTTSDFSDADFRAHDARFFPIFSGPHRGAWNSCSDCHTSVNQGSFQNFSCLNCHEHNRREMDEEHDDDDVRGYRYESNACLSCHPQGRE